MEQTNCIPNINAAQRRMRLISGIIMLVTGLVILLVMAALNLDPLWRLALYPIFVGAATGYFQWREKT
jgi:hypothetical protein